ncbi:hypothetical protein CLV92_102355 [Kineococcus xinjiangensis]|uniref:Pel9A-like right handed beta-helix region domain-containing protein n=2 Tax=Kineococcus xinjiangensis TaxID=512762 RepID=A0A2S6IV97_9ACTN|nr:hypothetical protein CLV92_102355 [Kineococcus xinjiangensis]
MDASHWTVQGLEIFGAKNHPFVCTSCTDDVFRLLDSDFHHNYDAATHGQNADGIDIEFGSGEGNLIKGVRLFNNADDGLDLWMFTSAVTIESTWAYGNGVDRFGDTAWEGNGNGFELGGGRPSPATAHVVRNSAAWDNTANGFTDNSNPGDLVIEGNTSFRNAANGYWFRSSAATLDRNLSVGDLRPFVAGTANRVGVNSWSTTTTSTTTGASVFVSTDPTSATGPRPADGTLPRTTFLTTRTAVLGAPMR